MRSMFIDRGTCIATTSNERVDLIGVLTLPALFAPNIDAGKLGRVVGERLLPLKGLLDIATDELDAILSAAELTIAT
jgi:hypothetical protein